MKPGRESQTSMMVAMARAIAHGRTPVSAYSDPTALVLLPEDARETLERIRGGIPPASAAERRSRHREGPLWTEIVTISRLRSWHP